MQKKLAEFVKDTAIREAKRTVGKSSYIGIHEVKVPQELLKAENNKED